MSDKFLPLPTRFSGQAWGGIFAEAPGRKKFFSKKVLVVSKKVLTFATANHERPLAWWFGRERIIDIDDTYNQVRGGARVCFMAYPMGRRGTKEIQWRV